MHCLTSWFWKPRLREAHFLQTGRLPTLTMFWWKKPPDWTTIGYWAKRRGKQGEARIVGWGRLCRAENVTPYGSMVLGADWVVVAEQSRRLTQ